MCYQPISWRPVQLGLQLSQSHRKCCINLLCNTQTRPKFIGYTACKVGIIWQSLALAGVDSVNNSVLISVFYWQQHHSESRQEVKLRTPIKRWGLRFLGTKVVFIEKGARLRPGSNYYVQTLKSLIDIQNGRSIFLKCSHLFIQRRWFWCSENAICYEWIFKFNQKELWLSQRACGNVRQQLTLTHRIIF